MVRLDRAGGYPIHGEAVFYIYSRERPLQNIRDRVIVAMDVEALYPSLEVRAVKKTVYRRVLKTEVKFENINHKDAAEYIAA